MHLAGFHYKKIHLNARSSECCISICLNSINYAANPSVVFQSILSLTPTSTYSSQQTLPPASHAGDLGQRQRQAMWYVWCTKVHRNRVVCEYFELPLSVSFHRYSTSIFHFSTTDTLHPMHLILATDSVDKQRYFR
jgi:hypothetical protein